VIVIVAGGHALLRRDLPSVERPMLPLAIGLAAAGCTDRVASVVRGVALLATPGLAPAEIPEIAAIRAWVAARYTPVRTVGPDRWTIYRRNPAQ
jgi:hypothetical protein